LIVLAVAYYWLWYGRSLGLVQIMITIQVSCWVLMTYCFITENFYTIINSYFSYQIGTSDTRPSLIIIIKRNQRNIQEIYDDRSKWIKIWHFSTNGLPFFKRLRFLSSKRFFRKKFLTYSVEMVKILILSVGPTKKSWGPFDTWTRTVDAGDRYPEHV